MNTLGERLKYLRKENNLKQQDIASATGIARSNISKIESDILSPTSNTIIALANYFDVSTDWLLLGRESSKGISPCYQASEIVRFTSRLPKALTGDIIQYIEFKVALNADNILPDLRATATDFSLRLEGKSLIQDKSNNQFIFIKKLKEKNEDMVKSIAFARLQEEDVLKQADIQLVGILLNEK